jgi:Ca2+-binding EF-hand superfamily protein
MANLYNPRAMFTQQSIGELMKVSDEKRGRREPYNKITKSRWFEIAGVLMSLGVVIEFGIVADQDLDTNSNVTGDVFSYLFAAYFFAEIVIRFLAYINPLAFFTDPIKGRFNALDSFLISIRLISLFILQYTLDDPDFTVIRLFRIFEMMRISRVWYFVPDVALTIDAMLSAGRRAVPIMCLMGITMYCGGVISTVWVKKIDGMLEAGYGGDPNFYYDRWGQVGYSMMVQLQLAVYDDVAATLNAVYVFSTPLTVFLFIMILVNAFMILNTLIGFIYDLVAETTERGNALEVTRSINKTFNMIDKDLSGDITEKEYEANAVPALKKFGINEDVVERAFDIIDSNANGSIDKSEFSAYLLKMLRPPSNEELIKLMSELNLVEKDIDEIEAILMSGQVSSASRSAVAVGPPTGNVRLRKGVFLTTIRSPERKK